MVQPHKAKQVSSLGETPAEARARMNSSGPTKRRQLGQEVSGLLQPQHIAAIREAEEGFKSSDVSDGAVEDAPELSEPPTPSKAMEFIRQLSQDKLQLQTERDSALNLVERYRAKYGMLD